MNPISQVLERNTRLLAEALACSLYPRMEAAAGGEAAGCSGQLFAGSWQPKESSLAGWLNLVTSYPRHPTLISDKNSGRIFNFANCDKVFFEASLHLAPSLTH